MTEDEAQGWIAGRYGIAACERVDGFLRRVVVETALQNLISPATIPHIWSRHAADSAQLLALAPEAWQHWLDIGTGGGFPGMIVALLAPDKAVTMIEPRRRRADFLQEIAGDFGLSRVKVLASKVEITNGQADIISARAVASIENLLRVAGHWAKTDTTWLLPRGRSGAADLDALPEKTRSMFHVEHSLTDLTSTILISRGTTQ